MAEQLCEDLQLGRVQSLVRAFGILDELAKGRHLTLKELAGAVDLPRSTAHRLLTTMEALRYLSFDRATNRWAIGAKAFAVGAVFASAREFAPVGQAIIRSLAAELDHTINISVPEGSGLCFIDRVGSGPNHPVFLQRGALLPLHMTASGKAMMAAWSRLDLDKYLKRVVLSGRTPQTIVDANRLREELCAVRERGFAIDDEEYDQGLRCVAAVVTDGCGPPRGAISISERCSHHPIARLREIGPSLARAAREMTKHDMLTAA